MRNLKFLQGKSALRQVVIALGNDKALVVREKISLVVLRKNDSIGFILYNVYSR